MLQKGNRNIKQEFETLLQGGTICVELNEQIVYNQVGEEEASVWSLLLASGYLKITGYEEGEAFENGRYELALTKQPKGERTKKVSQCETFFFLR